MRRANAVCKVSAIENRYSMMGRFYEKDFPAFEELNIAYVAYSPACEWNPYREIQSGNAI